MENTVVKAEISNEKSEPAIGILVAYLAFIVIFISVGFVFGSSDIKIFWYGLAFKIGTDVYVEYIAIFVAIMFVLFSMPFIIRAVHRRKKKLVSLTVTENEVICSYTAFIPIAKKSLRMPVEKIDNIEVVNVFLKIFDGKTLAIYSASSVVKIPFVKNADEVVTRTMEQIKAKKLEVPKIKNTDDIETLKKLAQLKDAGIINEEEYNKKKEELLSKI